MDVALVRYYSPMDISQEEDLRAIAQRHGVAVAVGTRTAVVAGRVVVYDATHGELAARWNLARALAHALGMDAERLFSGQ